MDDTISFGSSLYELMKTLNIRNKSLAQGINVDTSVISRWKNGSRRPPSNSNYVELISNYMAMTAITSYQLERLYSFAVSIGTDTSNCHCSLDVIRSILMHSYFEAETNPDSNKEKNTASNVNTALFELIEGGENIVSAGVNLISLMASCDSDENVFVCLPDGDISFSGDSGSKVRWCRSVSSLVAKEKRIVVFSKPENKTAAALIGYLSDCEFSSDHDWHHIDASRPEACTYMNFILVEGVGVLSLVDSSGSGSFDFAYLYTDSKSMELYSNVAKRLLKHK